MALNARQRLGPYEMIALLGSSEPKWCRTCNEIVYRSGNRWFSTEVRAGSSFDWKPPRMILQTQFNDSPGPSFGLSPDGQRILVVKRKEERPKNTIRVIHSWLGSNPQTEKEKGRTRESALHIKN